MTTIQIPKKLHKKLKQEAYDNDMTLQDLVEKRLS